MPLVIALWPNRTFSLVNMASGFSDVDLYHALDYEADPLIARCYVVSTDAEKQLHITSSFIEGELGKRAGDDNQQDACAAEYLTVAREDGRLRRYSWQKNVVQRYLRSQYASFRWSDNISQILQLHNAELGTMPVPPLPELTAKQVRSMPAFSGIYVAWNDDGSAHYVGESQDVPSRVSSSRPEIASRRIGVYKCEASERKRIECYFIGILNPAGNSQSTHRMSKRAE